MSRMSLEERLQNVDYRWLSDGSYVPSDFSAQFTYLVKCINGEEGESHKTPLFHLRMLDLMLESEKDLVNLVFRGGAKTTLFIEYLLPITAIMGRLPGLGDVSGMLYVSDSMDNGVKVMRENIEARYNRSEFLQKWLPRDKAIFTENKIKFVNVDGHSLTCRMYGAKTAIRGTKIDGRRPKLAILDDIIMDADADSPSVLKKINSTIYSAIEHALDPTCRKVVFNGTPFNSEDPIVKAVESNAWNVNVWPVARDWPCTREEFQGAWEDRFSYDKLMASYQKAVDVGEGSLWYRELMLRISSDEERLVQDDDIMWYDRDELLENKKYYNFYMTTDIATSEKETADFTGMLNWAVNYNGDYFLVDGICQRQDFSKTINQMFAFQQMYDMQSVGVEVTGQQQGFISIIKQEMQRRGQYFTLATDLRTGEEGIRPVTSKLTRFNTVVPQFKLKKVFLPEDMKGDPLIQRLLNQIRLATMGGLKGKDDLLDCVSMLAYMHVWKPAEPPPPKGRKNPGGMWGHRFGDSGGSALDPYIV